MSPPNVHRAYAAVLAIHSNRAASQSGRREETETTTSTSTDNDEMPPLIPNNESVPPMRSVTTTAIIEASSSRTSSSSNLPSAGSMRSTGGGHYPVLRNLVSLANRSRINNTNLAHQNANNLHHTSSSTSHRTLPNSRNGPPAIHPQFRSKAVCKLTCSACTAVVCSRGMKAILLADTKVELYSTDTPPIGVQLVNDDYMTRNCRCRIRDVACLGCGSVVGYHVTTPCNTCLEACNNGHFWMFHAEGIHSSDRMDETGTKTLLWATIPCTERDLEMIGKLREFLCR